MKEYNELKEIQNRAKVIYAEIINLLADAYTLGVRHGHNADEELYQRIMKAGAENGQAQQDD